jgi:hypothetical protein
MNLAADRKMDMVREAFDQSQVVEEATPAVLRSLMADNAAEDRMHRLNYRPIMRKFFIEAGYEMVNASVDPGVPTGMEPVAWTSIDERAFAYADIPVVDAAELLDVRGRITSQNASELDKAIVKRYYLYTHRGHRRRPA